MEQGKPLTVSAAPRVDYDAVCESVRAALEPARAHSISLHDLQGEVLWLSEGSIGPDEHNAVRQAMEAFADAQAAPMLGYDLGDSRSAVLARALDARRRMLGAVMIVMDTRSIARGLPKLMTPKLQRALIQFAATQQKQGPAVSAPPPPNTVPARFAKEGADRSASADASTPLSPGTQPLELEPLTLQPMAPQAMTPQPVTPQPPTLEPLSIQPLTLKSPPQQRLTLQPLAPSSAPQRINTGTPAIGQLHAALRDSPIALYVQRLIPLIKGSALKRYEVLLRSKSEGSANVAPQALLKQTVENGLGSMIDRRVITELMGFLARHPEIWQNDEAMFSVNLTSTALHDEHFMKFVELCLTRAQLPVGTIAFEIDVPTAMAIGQKITGVATALHRLGCPLVLDDFALRTQCFALLRLPGVRYVKIAAEVTAKMRTDKVSQAGITAIVQMARVLGMRTVAKHTETPAEHEWLTALGVDFVQSHSMSPPVAIESLHTRAAS